MVKVIWTDSAIQDLKEIGEYISKDSPRYAELTVSRLFEAPLILKDHPKVGRIVPEFALPSLRELIYGSYRVVYQIISSERIDILLVHNSARLLKNVIPSDDPHS